MNTIVVESSIYNGALNYARKHKTSVDELVRMYLYQLGSDVASYDLSVDSSLPQSVAQTEWKMSGLRGIISDRMSDKDARDEYINSKYGL